MSVVTESRSRAPAPRAAYAAVILCLAVAGVFAGVSEETAILGPEEAARYFSVLSFTPSLSRKPMAVEEDKGGLSYAMPLFTLRATVRCLDEARTRTWKLGFAQSVLDGEVAFHYEGGDNGWVFPTLPVSDAYDGETHWYNGEGGVDYCRGTVMAELRDSPSSTLPWRMSVGDGRSASSSMLLGIERRQSFVDYLVAYDEEGDRLFVLRELRWYADIAIAVDCSRPVGERARVERCDIRYGQRNGAGRGLVASWITGPTANESQVFVPWAGGARRNLVKP